MFKKSLRHSHLQGWLKSIELHWLFFESTLIYTRWRFFRAAGTHGALDQVHKPCNSEMIQPPLACASLWIVLGPSASASWWQSSRERERTAGFYRQTNGKEIPAGIPDFEPVICLLLLCVIEIASCEITFLIHEMSRKVPLFTVGLSPSQWLSLS